MSTALRAGSVYFGLMFALGFVLGTARVLILAPRLGVMAAVAIELPIMLAASWLACGWIVRRWHVPSGAAPRLAMGGLAFALLIAAESALGVIGFGRSAETQIAAFLAPEGLAGLAAQVAYGLFPLLERPALRG